ncbi:Protein FAR1-RELATED SEQUENCE 8 [Bienertia sinuspersici]
MYQKSKLTSHVRRQLLNDTTVGITISQLHTALVDKDVFGQSELFHMHWLDESGTLQEILWVDAPSRAAYQEFGYIVCFDATYLTYKYHLPFVNFVSTNHDGQNILLECALI